MLLSHQPWCLVCGPKVKSSCLEIMNLTPFTGTYHYILG